MLDAGPKVLLVTRDLEASHQPLFKILLKSLLKPLLKFSLVNTTRHMVDQPLEVTGELYYNNKQISKHMK